MQSRKANLSDNMTHRFVQTGDGFGHALNDPLTWTTINRQACMYSFLVSRVEYVHTYQIVSSAVLRRR